MRIFALTVGRNELGRYLTPMMMHLKGVVDGHFFYDDNSTDGTPLIAAEVGTCVARPGNVPSFVENEGEFRGAAWAAFEEHMKPTIGDWVLVIDCDEFLVTDCLLGEVKRCLKAHLIRAIHSATPWDVGVDLNIHEVFDIAHNEVPLVRVDQLWGTIHAPRLFPYRPDGFFTSGQFGVTAVPHYVMGGPWGNTEDVSILHFGYAKLEDRQLKYDRYNGGAGHLKAHIDSIMEPGELIPWEGRIPDLKSAPWTP